MNRPQPRFLLIALALCALLLIAAPRALAHCRLDHADPKVGSALSASPAEAKIWFTDELDMSETSIEVFDASGGQVDKKDTHRDADEKSAAAVSLPTLSAGKYKVVWRALCPQGHKTKGEFTFEVK
jgi:methionine-rich copper-binding protein CopC